MPDQDDQALTRRRFLQSAGAIAAGASAAGVVATGCVRVSDNRLPPITDAQRAGKRAADSTIGIVKCQSYQEDIFALLKPLLKDADLPDLKGKVVLVKPNMLDHIEGHPIATNPAVIEAAIKLADYLGAGKIIAGEAAAHNRDTQYLLANTGHGALYKKLGVEYVDLNIDDIEPADNPHPFSKLNPLYLPRTVAKADVVISVPKLKTHHWARMTCSMKNLFGCIPGRKYGYPKNVLHFHGIDNCILDINRIIRTPIQLVDAVVSMEGDGPIFGDPKQTNFIMLGNDAPATDSTCARLMGIHVQNVPYLRYAGQVIGNTDEKHIKNIGVAAAAVAVAFKPAPSFDSTGKSIKFEDPNESSS